jgi:hypothetical protein
MIKADAVSSQRAAASSNSKMLAQPATPKTSSSAGPGSKRAHWTEYFVINRTNRETRTSVNIYNMALAPSGTIPPAIPGRPYRCTCETHGGMRAGAYKDCRSINSVCIEVRHPLDWCPGCNPALDAPEVRDAREAIAERTGRRANGQGLRISAEARRALELHAMGRARVYYESRNWQVRDVSTTESYDLHCISPEGRELRVEVKGTTSTGAQILLTPNEVGYAREYYPSVALYVLSNVRLVQRSDGGPVASGGDVVIYDPWSIVAGPLVPVGFAYTTPRATLESGYSN